MAVLYFTNNASTGAGSLVEAVKKAQPGDVVRPDESVFERGSTIEIALASSLNVAKNLTLDASPCRVRFVGGGATGLVYVRSGAAARFVGFDFVGGVNSSTYYHGGGATLSENSNAVFNRCLFAGCETSRSGGAVFIPAGSSAEVRDSVIVGCRAASTAGGLCASGSATVSGSTIIGNVDSTGVNDVGGSGKAAFVNSIIGASTAKTSSESVGSVVGVASSTVGFIASPPDDLTPEDWNANLWQDWDLRLFDDASPNPSPYRDSGDVGKMSQYDLQGNFRGRKTNGVETCSPGAYETLQADLFWVGEPFPQEMVDAAPQNIRVANYRQTTGSTLFGADMTWEIPDGVSYSSILGQYSSNNGLTWSNLGYVAANATSRNATQITPGKEYQVRLRGVFADGSYTAWSVITYASPLELDGSNGEQSWELRLPSALSVVNPSFQTSSGWATSRFATAFGDVAPQAGQTLFVDGVVVFGDALPTFSESVASVVVGGFAKVDFNAANAVGLALFSVGYGSLTTAKTRLEKSYSTGRVAAWARLTGQIVASIPCEFDANAYVVAGYFYNSFVSPSPTYGALFVAPSASGRVRLEGVYSCDSFRTTAEGTLPTRTIKIGDAATIRARSVSFLASVEAPFETLFDKRVAIELQGAATATVGDGAPASWADAFEIDVSDATASNLKLNGQTVYGDAPTCAVALTGSAKIDERGLDVASLTLNTGTTLNVDGGKSRVATLNVVDGANVEFSGVDAVLTTTESATVGAATFTGAGYFATPAGTDASAATFAETIRICDYGAGVQTFSAITIGSGRASLSWTQTNDAAPVCVERQTVTGWDVLSVSATSPIETTLAGAATFRIFDGERFLRDAAWTYKIGTQWRATVTVRAVQNDKKTAYTAQTLLVGVSMDGTIKSGESVTLLARVYDAYDNDVPLLNTGLNVLGVKYTVEKAGSFFPGSALSDTSVAGHTDVDAGTQCVLEVPETSDAWPDEPGYTFALTPDNTVNPVFPTPGTYTIRVKITLADANPVVFSETIRVE